MNIKSILFTAALGFGALVNAQEVGVLSKNTEEGVKLKFIPADASTWMLSLDYGFTIERKTQDQDSYEDLNTQPILPYDRNNWLKLENGEELYDLWVKSQRNIAAVKSSGSGEQALLRMEELENEYPFFILLTTRIADFSRGSGLEFVDRNVEPGKSYDYRVSIVSPYDTLATFHSHYYSRDRLVSPLPEVSFEKERVTFQWSHRDDGNLVSYNLIRSVDRSGGSAINRAPIYYNSHLAPSDTSGVLQANTVYYRDSLQEGETGYYRLQAIDAWGETCASSEWLEVKMPDLTPPEKIYSITVEETDDYSVMVRWEYSPNEPILGYLPYVAEDEDGPYVPLSDGYINENEIRISELEELQDNYFRIAVVDTSFNYSLSDPEYFYLSNTRPPAPPTGVKWEVDSLGVVSLTWKANQESDLKGYVVLSSYKRSTNFVSLTPLLLTTHGFVDTIPLDQLSNSRYYTVAAVDQSFNYSEFGDTILVVAPDTLPPASPVLRNLSIIDGSFNLDFIKSPSEDLLQYSLKKEDGNGEWIEIGSFNSSQSTPIKVSNMEMVQGRYSLVAIDSSGNQSVRSNVVTLRSIDNEVVEIEIQTEDRKNGSGVRLTWTPVPGAQKYKVYRSSADQRLQPVAMSDRSEYTDTLRPGDQTYSYKVVALNDVGQQVGMSNSISYKF